MVRLKWPADADYGEEESYSWRVLHPNKWNRDVPYAWRFDPSDLRASDVRRGR